MGGPDNLADSGQLSALRAHISHGRAQCAGYNPVSRTHPTALCFSLFTFFSSGAPQRVSVVSDGSRENFQNWVKTSECVSLNRLVLSGLKGFSKNSKILSKTPLGGVWEVAAARAAVIFTTPM
jgi:hypothetical protein